MSQKRNNPRPKQDQAWFTFTPQLHSDMFDRYVDLIVCGQKTSADEEINACCASYCIFHVTNEVEVFQWSVYIKDTFSALYKYKTAIYYGIQCDSIASRGQTWDQKRFHRPISQKKYIKVTSRILSSVYKRNYLEAEQKKKLNIK